MCCVAALYELAGEIKANRGQYGNMSSAIRLFVLEHFKDRASPGG